MLGLVLRERTLNLEGDSEFCQHFTESIGIFGSINELHERYEDLVSKRGDLKEDVSADDNKKRLDIICDFPPVFTAAVIRDKCTVLGIFPRTGIVPGIKG